MSQKRTAVMSEERARQLLKRAALTVFAMLALVVAGAVLASIHEAWLGGPLLVTGVIALIGLGVYFLGTLGHLAVGLGRSPVYWVGGTFLLQKLILVFAWLLALVLMHKAINETYREAVETP